MIPTILLNNGTFVPITDDVREEAALICAIAASNDNLTENYEEVAELLDIEFEGPAFVLAFAAWQHVVDEVYAQRAVLEGDTDAEAEALLRSGWTP